MKALKQAIEALHAYQRPLLHQPKIKSQRKIFVIGWTNKPRRARRLQNI